jgi:catechol 2,3-dioxygenase-like lactoylglutathione lyase family enzyme
MICLVEYLFESTLPDRGPINYNRSKISIHHVGTVCIFVNDQDRAKEFYTNVLGLELRTDQPLYPGAEARWVALAPKGATTELILYLSDENWEHYRQVVGKSQAITLDVTDMSSEFNRLKSKRGKIRAGTRSPTLGDLRDHRRLGRKQDPVG